MIFEYSYWWILLIVAVSFWVARIKFRKISRLPDVRTGMNILISSIRFLTVFLLLFLLLKPVLSLYRNIKEKPILIVAQDNSMSLLNNKDSLYFKTDYKKELERKISALNDQFSVEWLVFGKNVYQNKEIDFSEHYTDISEVFAYIDDNYKYRKPASVILLSDGIYNTGVNPRYKINNYPVNTIVLGDTTEFPDVFIKSTSINKFNFQHTIFPIKIEVAAIRQKGKNIKSVLKENGRILDSQELYIDNDNFLKEVTFTVEAQQKGLKKYTVVLETNFTEHSRENNTTTLYTNILDNSGDINVFYSSPHPDVAALTEAINISGVYEYKTENLDDFSGTTEANLLILHNPDPKHPNYQKLADIALKRKIPVWYILTERKSINDFGGQGRDYSINLNSNINENATPGFDRSFPFFELTEQEIQGYTNYPPLVVPFGEIKSQTGKNLFVQKIKSIDTGNALMSFYDKNGLKTAYLWGEGIWRWRLFSYRESGSHDLFNTLIHKTVNYLIAKRGNDRFVNDIKALYDETEEAVIHVELYNESYELINTPDVYLQLRNEGREYSYVLNRYGDKYRINLGNLPAGEYQYVLKTSLKGENFEKKGSYFVRTQNMELNDMVANHALLKGISEHSGGESVNFRDLDQLVDRIKSDSKLMSVEKKEIKYVELGELGWLGMLLLLLLCIEWFLLRYFTD
ncbi:hypothetical protein LJC12_03565 [Odoribacter sp. OttesenSCG-928-J03]|nr:hypothetical protein [Odoribacter sp. OttesenSCG-928-J03]MDL2330654.1 hypothetical protein [Odoribacter sp. OttesenSCG-928-A06]